ncbi:MAG: oxygenase MpaB family protein [Acidimicrobiales bacterium]
MAAVSSAPPMSDLSGVGLLAGAANVIMQLAQPPVGYGVAESTVESGQLFRHPLKRTRTTLTYLAVALMGDDEDRRRYRRAVDGSHARVRSGPDSPVAYNAFDTDLQLWVAACLYVGVEDVYSRLHGPLTGAEADAFYRQGARLGTTLQVGEDQWPPDRAAFGHYWEKGVGGAHIDSTVRAYLDDVVMLRFLPWPAPALFGGLNRFVTTGFLPQPFRDRMHYRWGARDQRRFDACISVVAAVDRWMPVVVRQFPFNACLWDVRRRARAGMPLV